MRDHKVKWTLQQYTTHNIVHSNIKQSLIFYEMFLHQIVRPPPFTIDVYVYFLYNVFIDLLMN
jgi:hypothetical protein